MDIRVASLDGKALENLDYKQVRGLEHKMFEYRGGVSSIKSGKLLNKIRPLNLESKKFANKVDEYLSAALKFLNKIS